MHGAPPWCVDSGNTNSVQQSLLIAQGDRFVGDVVNKITSSSVWATMRSWSRLTKVIRRRAEF